MNIEVKSIGHIETNDTYKIVIDKEYIKGLKGLSEFKYINVLFYFHEIENTVELIEIKPYKKGPEKLGVFATRTPNRPNKIGQETVYIIDIDEEKGIIEIPYIDAFDGTPILDIKPYTPSIDRVEHVEVPAWCKNWPDCYEKSGDFDWSNVFNF